MDALYIAVTISIVSCKITSTTRMDMATPINREEQRVIHIMSSLPLQIPIMSQCQGFPLHFHANCEPPMSENAQTTGTMTMRIVSEKTVLYMTIKSSLQLPLPLAFATMVVVLSVEVVWWWRFGFPQRPSHRTLPLPPLTLCKRSINN